MLSYREFHLGIVMMQTKATICTRKDNPIKTFDSNVRAFSPGVWFGFVGTLATFSFAFWMTYSVYEKMPNKAYHLIQPKTKLDFIIKTVAAIVEPDPLEWFDTTLHVGKALCLLWSIFGLVMTMAYTSNLRANLIAVDFEENLDTMDKVLATVNKIYVVRNAARLK